MTKSRNNNRSRQHITAVAYAATASQTDSDGFLAEKDLLAEFGRCLPAAIAGNPGAALELTIRSEEDFAKRYIRARRPRKHKGGSFYTENAYVRVGKGLYRRMEDCTATDLEAWGSGVSRASDSRSVLAEEVQVYVRQRLVELLDFANAGMRLGEIEVRKFGYVKRAEPDPGLFDMDEAEDDEGEIDA